MNDLEKRLDELKKEVTRRGFDRHASLLKNVSELPTELQSPTVTTLDARETMQTIIVFPPQIQRGYHYVPKQALLFTATGLIHLLASIWPEQGPQITSVEGCHLLYLKIKLILLYGLLEIVSQGQSAPVHLRMEFNTVSWHHLWLPLQQLLQASQHTSILPIDQNASSPVFQRALQELPLKFANGLQIYGLLPGETLEDAVFQAGTWERWLYFFRKPVSANTMLLLTSHYMVVIHEELYIKHGWVISYIPRNRIVGMQNQSCDPWNELSVQLKEGNPSVNYKLTLKNGTVEAWRKPWLQHGGMWEDLPHPQN